MRRNAKRAGHGSASLRAVSVILLVLLFVGVLFLLRARADSGSSPAPTPRPESLAAATPAPMPEVPEESLPPDSYRILLVSDGKESILTATDGLPLELPEAEAPAGYRFFGWADESGALLPEGAVFPGGDARYEAVFYLSLDDAHGAYLPLDGSGQARPGELMPRSDAAIMLSGLITAEPPAPEQEPEPDPKDKKKDKSKDEPALFDDVTEKDACYEACAALHAFGILEGGSFRPEDALTRGELFELLSRFYPAADGLWLFSDLDEGSERRAAFCLAAERGWIDYADGMMAEADTELTRLQVALLMNRVLGRAADPAVLQEDLSAIGDLPEDETDRLAILEAMIPHALGESEGGELWADCEIPTLPIPGFTTRDLEVDAWLKNILDTTTNDSMELKEKLRVLYLYVRDSFRYRKGEIYEGPDPTLLTAETRKMMEEEGGNCYTHAALLCELYRALGVDAKVYAGTVSNSQNPHAWVEATINGRTYVFDAELEKTKIRFSQPYFDFFMRTYYDVKGWDYQREFILG